MPALHEWTRRWICRILFVGLCLVPTLLVVWWCIWHRTPGRLRACETAIGCELGLDVSLARITNPQPGTTAYQRMALADEETGEPLLQAGSLRSVRDSRGLTVALSEVEVSSRGLARLWEILLRRLQSRALEPLCLLAGPIRYGDGNSSQELSHVRGQMKTAEGGAEMAIQFRLLPAKESGSLGLRVVRNRQTMPPATRLELDASSAPLPAQLLAAIMPQFEALGARCQFQGRLWASQVEREWDVELSGELTGVDLDQLVSQRFPHRLTGSARVAVRRAIFRHGRLEAASGTIVAGPGVISPSLYAAAVQALHVVAARLAHEHRGDLPYEQLALHFSVDVGGLSLRGACQEMPAGTILAGQSDLLLLHEPPYQPLPVVALVHALAPRSDVMVPATQDTQRLTNMLPLPTSTSVRAAAQTRQ